MLILRQLYEYLKLRVWRINIILTQFSPIQPFAEGNLVIVVFFVISSQSFMRLSHQVVDSYDSPQFPIFVTLTKFFLFLFFFTIILPLCQVVCSELDSLFVTYMSCECQILRALFPHYIQQKFELSLPEHEYNCLFSFHLPKPFS